MAYFFLRRGSLRNLLYSKGYIKGYIKGRKVEKHSSNALQSLL